MSSEKQKIFMKEKNQIEIGFSSKLWKDDSGTVSTDKREKGRQPKNPLSSFQNTFHPLWQKENSQGFRDFNSQDSVCGNNLRKE